MARKCSEGASRGGKVELHSITISPSKRQPEKSHATSVKTSVSTFKRGHWVFESISLNMHVADGGFEAKLSLINAASKGLVYLKGQINGTNVSMLIDT